MPTLNFIKKNTTFPLIESLTETSYLEDDVSDDYDITDLEFYILLNKSGRDDISKENIEYEP